VVAVAAVVHLVALHNPQVLAGAVVVVMQRH
jgi:hypothetical protein